MAKRVTDKAMMNMLVAQCKEWEEGIGCDKAGRIYFTVADYADPRKALRAAIRAEKKR